MNDNKLNYFYHVSRDIELEDKEFYPRIPEHRCEGEDDKIQRICVCTSLKEALDAFPYKYDFVNNTMRSNENNSYLIYYKIKNNDLNYKTSTEIHHLVPDAHITNEHWILDSFIAKPNLIKIKDLKLSKDNKHINESYGEISNFEYENIVEKYERYEEMIFIGKFAKKALLWAKRNNIDYDILDSSYEHLHHRLFKITNDTYNGTSKTYKYLKIKFIIPSGINVSELWMLDVKQEIFAKRKNIYLTPFKLRKENIAILKECMEAGYTF